MRTPTVHLLLTLGLAAGLPSAGHSQTLPTATEVNAALIATPRDEWMQSHRAQVAAAHKIGPAVIFMGDSITAGWSQSGSGIWKERYAPLKAARIAIAGDRIENLLWRLQNGAIGGELRPKVVVLMIGTNNGKGTPAQIAEGIEALVKEIHGRSPETKVLVLGILPRGEKPNGWRERNDKANALLAKLEDGQRVWFLSFGEKFLQPDGTISKTVMPDFLHPGGEGYRIWADAMDAKLAGLLK